MTNVTSSRSCHPSLINVNLINSQKETWLLFDWCAVIAKDKLLLNVTQYSKCFCLLSSGWIRRTPTFEYCISNKPDTDLLVLPVCRSHSIMFVSSEPLYNKLSSGCHWTQFTPPLWPPSWQRQKVIVSGGKLSFISFKNAQQYNNNALKCFSSPGCSAELPLLCCRWAHCPLPCPSPTGRPSPPPARPPISSSSSEAPPGTQHIVQISALFKHL